MTAPIYPDLFKQMWRETGVKVALVSEAQPKKKSDCPNCGGSGRMETFIAKNGPFDAPAIKGVSKFHNGKWWKGENFTALCPVCQGDGHAKTPGTQPAGREYAR